MAQTGYIGINGKGNGNFTTTHAIEDGKPLCNRKNTHVIATNSQTATVDNVTCKGCRAKLA